MALSLYVKLPLAFRINSLLKLRNTSCVPRMFSVSTKSAPILKPRQLNLEIKRTFLNILKKSNAEKLKQLDGIPEDYKLIYRCTMHRYLVSAQVISTIAGIIGLVGLGLNNWEFNLNTLTEHWTEETKPMAVENEGLIYLTAFVTFFCILQVMLMKLPVRIYNLPQKEKYVFVFYGNLAFTKKRITCKVKEVIKLEDSGILPWRQSRYQIINSRDIILIENWFRRPADLNIMLGWQKPPEDYD